MTPFTRPSARLLALPMAAVFSLASACSDSPVAPTPAPGPDPVPDAATYDLVFEQTAGLLNASELRLRRRGEDTDALLFGQQMLGIEPSVTADGRTFVYQGFGGVLGDDSDLWLVRSGEPPRRIALPLGDVEFAPSVSPDGSKLAYIRLGEDGYTRLYVARVDGSERREVGAEIQVSPVANSTPAWSPDGSQLAWSVGAPGAMRVAVIKADGTGMRVVSAGVVGGSDIDASWSPDGKQLVFVRTPNAGASDLVVVTLSTGVEHVFGLPRRNRQPAWAPNGQTIVFSSTMDATEADSELYSIKPDGSALLRLTRDELNQRHPIWVRR